MEGEIILISGAVSETTAEDATGTLETLKSKVDALLVTFQDLVRERNELVRALATQREVSRKLEKKIELISQDKEKVKSRVDRLLSRLSGMNG